jgi:hypothetical protein
MAQPNNATPQTAKRMAIPSDASGQSKVKAESQAMLSSTEGDVVNDRIQRPRGNCLAPLPFAVRIRCIRYSREL